MLFQQQYPPEVRANGKAFNVIASAQFFHTGSFGMFQDKLAPLQQVNSPKRRDTVMWDTCCPDILFDKISSESRGILGVFVNFEGFCEFIGI